MRCWDRRAPTGGIFLLCHLFVPINVNSNHWTCATINFQDQTLQHFDSVGSDGTCCLQNILHCLQLEHDAMHRSSLPTNWHLSPSPLAPFPQQNNGFNCGVWLCATVGLVIQAVPLEFSPTDIQTHRRRMALSLSQGHASLL